MIELVIIHTFLSSFKTAQPNNSIHWYLPFSRMNLFPLIRAITVKMLMVLDRKRLEPEPTDQINLLKSVLPTGMIAHNDTFKVSKQPKFSFINLKGSPISHFLTWKTQYIPERDSTFFFIFFYLQQNPFRPSDTEGWWETNSLPFSCESRIN